MKNYYGDHTRGTRWCHICNAFTEHEDGVCDSDRHDEMFLYFVENLPNTEERKQFLRDETGEDEDEIEEYLIQNGLLDEEEENE